VGALEIGAAYCRERLPAIDRVWHTVLDGLAALGSRCEVGPAEGALYVFTRIDTALSAMDLVRRLIAGVAVIPGHTFGMDEGCSGCPSGPWTATLPTKACADWCAAYGRWPDGRWARLFAIRAREGLIGVEHGPLTPGRPDPESL